MSLKFLGTLSALDWYRCRNCGMDMNEPSIGIEAVPENVLKVLDEHGCKPWNLDPTFCETHDQHFPCDRVLW